jgi:hypothetical protein
MSTGFTKKPTLTHIKTSPLNKRNSSSSFQRSKNIISSPSNKNRRNTPASSKQNSNRDNYSENYSNIEDNPLDTTE